MRHVVVGIWDSAVGAYNRPWVAPTRAAAQRAFSDEVNRSGADMYAHPDDFELHHIADWEDSDGAFYKAGGERTIVRGKDVIKGER